MSLSSWVAGRYPYLAIATAISALWASDVGAQQLTINTPSALNISGSGQGELALYQDAATVAGVGTVDIVAEMLTASFDHRFQVVGGRPALRSNGQDPVYVRWSLYQANTYSFATNSGVPVTADAFVQINDVDGPGNEEVFVPVCDGTVSFVRIDSAATTDRAFGTVGGRPEIFSLIGDQNYNNQPESGVEISYGGVSSFEFGRTANNGFLIRLDNPSYSAFDSLDYQCADFVPPVAVDDEETGTAGDPVTIDVLTNDTIATANDNGPNNNSGAPSEYGAQSVSLVNPGGGATTVTDADGDIVQVTVPGEGTWTVDDTTGQVTFTPLPNFNGQVTSIDYTFENGLGVSSDPATATVRYPIPDPVFNGGSGPVSSCTASTLTTTALLTDDGGSYDGGNAVSYADAAGSGVAITFTKVSGSDSAGGASAPFYAANFPDPVRGLWLGSDDRFPSKFTGTGLDTESYRIDFSPAISQATLDFTALNFNIDGDERIQITGINGSPATIATNFQFIPSGDVVFNTATGRIEGGSTFTAAGSDGGTLVIDNAAGISSISFDRIEIDNVNSSIPAPNRNRSNGVVLGPFGFCPPQVDPVAEDDVVTGLPTATPATLNPLADNGNGPDNDPDGTLDPTTVVLTGTGAPAGSTLSADGKTLTVPDEGVWTVATSGEVTFTPEAGFTADPTPVAYTVDDNGGNTSNEATITLAFVAQPPVAQDDVISGLPTNTPATLNPLADNGNGADDDPDGALDPSSVRFTGTNAPAGSSVSGDGKTLTVPDEGVWTIAASGEVTFTPATGFTGDPTPAAYTVDDNDDNTSNEATITLDFTAQPPVAQDDVVSGLPTNTPATVDPFIDNGNGVDADPDGTLDPATTVFTGTGAPTGTTVSGDGKTLTVPDEGVWTIAASGEVTFTPDTGFTGDPTPAAYTVADNDGNTSNEATITLDFVAQPPVAQDDIVTGLPTNTPATLNPFADNGSGIDDDPDGDLDATSVVFTGTGSPTGATVSGDGKTLTVPDEGVWTIATSGEVTFTPEAGFTADPTPAAYTVDDNDGNTSNEATITLDFAAQPPVAVDDVVDNLPTSTPATVNPLAANGGVADSDPDGTLDPTSIVFTGTGAPAGTTVSPDGKTLTVPDEGVWTIAPSGEVTFTPQSGFFADPTPAAYTVDDNDGNTSNEATITLDFNPPVILADDDDFSATPVTSLDGGPAGNVLDGDTLDGNPIDTTLTTILVNGDGGLTGVTIDDDGTLNVPPLTPAGTYTVTYQLCEDANADTSTNPATGNCDTATVTVVVDEPQILAQDNDFSPFPVDGFAGGTTASVLPNDSYNNDPLVLDGSGVPTQVTLTPGTIPSPPAAGGLTMNPDGTITVAPGTTAGTYTFPYTISDNLNSGSTSTAVATIVVGAATINAVSEGAAIVPANTATTALNVLTSDRINDIQATTTNVTIQEVGITYFADGSALPGPPASGGVTLNTTTGDVEVDGASQGFRAEIEYRICDVTNPTNCDTAIETVIVPPLDLEALPETFPPVNGLDGATLSDSVITSDVGGDGTGATFPVNFTPGDTYEVSVAEVSIVNNDTGLATTDISLDETTGLITVDPNTPAGEYGVTYEICLLQSGPPTICRQLEELVNVTAAPIAAVADNVTGIDGNTGATDVLTVYGNDTLNGSTITPAQITNGDVTVAVITPATPQNGAPVPVLDPTDGTVDVPAGTPAGSYDIVYEVCEALNTYTTPAPGNRNCATAIATVVVDLPPIVAVDDDFSATPVDGVDGGPVGSIFDPAGDDTLDGVAVSAADITSGAISLALTSPATPINGGPVPSLDTATGDVAVPPGTPAGIYTFDYTICDVVNTFGAETNCDTATVTVAVDPPSIVATPDSVADIDGSTGADDVLSVLGNDALNTDPITVADITAGDVTLAVITPATSINGGPVPVLDPADGTVDVPAGTPQGTYVITYEICDTLNTFGSQTNCATTTATVDVQPDPPVAQDDLISGLPTNTPATLNPLADNGSGADDDPDGSLDPTTVVFTGTGAPAGSAVSPDGKTLTVPDEGVWTIAPSGDVTFTPATGFTADPTPAAYTVNDNDGNTSNEATITLDFDAQAPVAADDTVAGLPTNTPATLNPLVDNGSGPDADPDGELDPTTLALTDPAATDTNADGFPDTLVVTGEGTWTVDPSSGDVTFTPETGFTADPSPVTYTVDDNDGNTSNPATITLDFDTQAPVAEDDVVAGLPTNTPATFDPLADNGNGPDADPDGALDPTSIALVDPTATDTNGDGFPDTLVVTGEGTWTVDPTSGEITFTPETGFTADPTPVSYTVDDNDGNTSNTATVTLDFDAQNPVATDDVVAGLPTNTPATLNPLADNGNGVDSDPDGALDPTSVVFTGTGAPSGSTVSPDGKTLTVPDEGVWTIAPSGEVTFTPAAGFTADPTPAAYTVADNDGNVSNEATITLDFDAQDPVATDDVVADLPTNMAVTIDPLVDNGNGVDFDPDGSLDPTSVALTDPAATDTNGDGFPDTLVVADEGTWTIDPTNGEVTFTPEAGFTADPTPVGYTINDNDGNTSNEATITLDFDAQIPAAADDVVAGLPTNTPATLNPLADNGNGPDADPDGELDPTTVALTDPAATDSNGDGLPDTLVVPDEGTWTVEPTTGEVTFTPETGFTADPTPVEYTVNDNDGNTSNAATITLDFDIQVPTATDDLVAGLPTNTPATLNPLDDNGNGVDSDPDGALDPTSVVFTGTGAPGGSSVSPDGKTLTVPDEGVWTIAPSGEVTFTPATGFTADPTPAAYTVADNDGNVSNEATITLDFDVQPPVATDDLVTGLETNTPATMSPLGNDTDPDGALDPTTVALVDPAATDSNGDGFPDTLVVADEGTWTVDPTNGEVTFAPEPGFTADPTPVGYTVDDNDGNTSNEAIITLDFDQAPPDAVDDTAEGTVGEPATVDVLANDTDPDDDIDPTTVALVDPNATDTDGDGDADTLIVDGQGVWTVDPDTGAITFTAEPAFAGDPDPISYTVSDATGLTSDPADVIIDYPETGTLLSGTAFLDNDANGVFDPAIDELLPGISVELVDPDGNLIAAGVTDADGNYELTNFAIGEDFTLSFIDPATQEVLATIEDLDFVAGTVLTDVDAAVVPSIPVGSLEIAKNALIRDVVIGGTAPFEIVVTNLTDAEVGPFTVQDRLPVGLIYTPETATVDGVATEPAVAGRTLTFDGVELAPNETVTIFLQTRVTTNAPNGDITNRAVVIDPDTGIAITSEAEATVRRRPEAVFNCSDVIGKVFDDRNMDGYQNPPPNRPQLSGRGPIVDFDAPLPGKLSDAFDELVLEGEPGLPNVRVVTPTGTIITTDQYGRFSVPCAELPGAIGTNFALKVDTNSLPTGYRMTTDNPLVTRLTAGSFAEMNFGAAIGRVVAIDLTDAAFRSGSTQPVERLEQGLLSLLEQVKDTPSVIRLSYFSNGETARTIGARLDAVEAIINNRWNAIGRYRLVIERITKRLQ